MRRTLSLLAVVFALVGAVSGCAVTDEQDALGPSVYASRPEPPARIGLPPAYRAFYDELGDEGDWALIEPYGYCFRPRVNYVAWRPYQDGWWDVSDYYGWIWNSDEPFGWITYHYGSWFYDEYQGWVWQPGPVWGPAWVAWVEAGDYIGWAPLAPTPFNSFDRVPDGVFTFTTATQLANGNVAQKALFVTRLPERAGALRPIISVGHAHGVAFNMGPSPYQLQQRGIVTGGRSDDDAIPRVKLPPSTLRLGEAELLERTNALITAGQHQLRSLREGSRPPAPSVSPPPPAPAERPHPNRKPFATPVPADSVQERGPAPTPTPADTTGGRARKPARRPGAAPDSTRAR